MLNDPQISRILCDLVEQEMAGRQPWPQVLADVVRRTSLELAPVCQVCTTKLSGLHSMHELWPTLLDGTFIVNF
jgi:hypothetical protein